jgi:hypothetical protein
MMIIDSIIFLTYAAPGSLNKKIEAYLFVSIYVHITISEDYITTI